MNKVGRVLLLVLLPAHPLQAHDLWVTSTDDGYAVMRGHLPDRFDLYEPECVQTLIAFDEKGLPLPLKRLDRKQRVLVKTPSDPALVAVVSKWGYRIIDGDGKKQFMSKAEALQSGIVVKEAFFSTQYSKTLFRFNERFAKPLGMKFEVVPLKSPLGLHEGDLLPVQVLLETLGSGRDQGLVSCSFSSWTVRSSLAVPCLTRRTARPRGRAILPQH